MFDAGLLGIALGAFGMLIIGFVAFSLVVAMIGKGIRRAL